MPRKKAGVGADVKSAGEAGSETAAEASVFDRATAQVLPDGRVEVAIVDDPEKPCDELIGRTSPAKAAQFIFNDLCPAALTAMRTAKPFKQEG